MIFLVGSFETLLKMINTEIIKTQTATSFSLITFERNCKLGTGLNDEYCSNNAFFGIYLGKLISGYLTVPLEFRETVLHEFFSFS